MSEHAGEVDSIAPESDAVPAQSGRQLAAAREKTGLSIEDVAHHLKLSPWQVEAMEAGDYQRLPGPVFVRGFIRNYARLVKLDPALLPDSTDQNMAQTATLGPEIQHSVNIPFPTGRESSWHKAAVGALLVLALVVIYEFSDNDVAEVTVTARPVALPRGELDADRPAMPPPPASEAHRSEIPNSQAVTELSAKAGDDPGTAVKAVTARRRPGEHMLRLKFDSESWVEVRDRDGRPIFSQLNRAGTESVVSGLPPLALVVGNAAGVHVSHNDQPVNLAPHTKVDVARLTLE